MTQPSRSDIQAEEERLKALFEKDEKADDWFTLIFVVICLLSAIYAMIAPFINPFLFSK